MQEKPLTFPCGANTLLGIVARPVGAIGRIGVVVLVGGPQYRVGSHRQFTLLARHLATQGVASLRFDHRGNGDSDGEPALGIDNAEDDIRAAIDALLADQPALQGVVLWGLCGAASACALYAPKDARVAGLVMLNPWVRTEAGLAKTRLKHYYLGRLADGEFWQRLFRGEVALGRAFSGVTQSMAKAFGRTGPEASEAIQGAKSPTSHYVDVRSATLPERMVRALQATKRPVLVVLSGDTDMTANEYREASASTPEWRAWVSSALVSTHEVAGSNHTFARADWRAEVEALTLRFVKPL